MDENGFDLVHRFGFLYRLKRNATIYALLVVFVYMAVVNDWQRFEFKLVELVFSMMFYNQAINIRFNWQLFLVNIVKFINLG